MHYICPVTPSGTWGLAAQEPRFKGITNATPLGLALHKSGHTRTLNPPSFSLLFQSLLI